MGLRNSWVWIIDDDDDGFKDDDNDVDDAGDDGFEDYDNKFILIRDDHLALLSGHRGHTLPFNANGGFSIQHMCATNIINVIIMRIIIVIIAIAMM